MRGITITNEAIWKNYTINNPWQHNDTPINQISLVKASSIEVFLHFKPMNSLWHYLGKDISMESFLTKDIWMSSLCIIVQLWDVDYVIFTSQERMGFWDL